MFLIHLVEASLTDSISAFVSNLYGTFGLAGIVVAMAIESCCIPLPSELVMPLAGAYFASKTLLTGVSTIPGLLLIALAGSLGCLIGSVVAYWIGYTGGRPLMLKYGRFVLISQHDADRADAFFARWGSSTAFFSRLLPVVRTYISLPAGVTRMNFVKFCVYTVLGSFPWCLLLAFVGYKLGQNSSTLGTVFHGLDVVIILAVVLLVALYIWRHISNDRKARAAQNQSASAAQLIPPTNQAPQPHSSNNWNWQQPPQQAQPQWSQPSQPQQPPQQSGWGQVPASPSQQTWGQTPGQPAQYPPQQPAQSGWSQSPPQGQGWNQQPGQPAPGGSDAWNRQQR